MLVDPFLFNENYFSFNNLSSTLLEIKSPLSPSSPPIQDKFSICNDIDEELETRIDNMQLLNDYKKFNLAKINKQMKLDKK